MTTDKHETKAEAGSGKIPLQRLVSCGIYKPNREDSVVFLQLLFQKKTIRFGFWFKGKRFPGFVRSDFTNRWWFDKGSVELDFWRFSFARVPYRFEF